MVFEYGVTKKSLKVILNWETPVKQRLPALFELSSTLIVLLYCALKESRFHVENWISTGGELKKTDIKCAIIRLRRNIAV